MFPPPGTKSCAKLEAGCPEGVFLGRLVTFEREEREREGEKASRKEKNR